MRKVDVIFFDGDGVTIKSGPMFSEHYADVSGVPPEQLTPFFAGPFQDAMIGKAKLRDLLEQHQDIWQWDKTIDELIEWWLKFEDRPDEAVLQFVDELRRKGIRCGLASAQVAERGRYIRAEMGFEERFDAFCISGDLGVKKPDPAFYQACMDALQLTEPSRILFVDDTPKAVEGAVQFGMRGFLYTSLEPLKLELRSLGVEVV